LVAYDVLETHPGAFIPILLQFTVGARAAESCWGLSKKHRKRDKLEPIRVRSFTFSGGLYGLGTVVIPCHKTKDREIVYRNVDLTPFAYSFWHPIITGMSKRGLEKQPIFDGTYSVVTRAQNETYRRLGIFKIIAERCEVPESTVGKSCGANKSLGRHTFLTSVYYHAVHTLNKPMTYARGQAGHTERSHTLERAYLALSNVVVADEYTHMTAPAGFQFDPVDAENRHKTKNREKTRAAHQEWNASLSSEAREELILNRVEGRKKFDTSPEYAEKRMERNRKLSVNAKKQWEAKSPEEKKRSLEAMVEANRRRRAGMTEDERAAFVRARLLRLKEGQERVPPELRKARAIKGAITRKLRFSLLSAEEQARKSLEQRQRMIAAQRIGVFKRLNGTIIKSSPPIIEGD
jgi:hypothetical protein